MARIIEAVGETASAFKKGDRMFTTSMISGDSADYAPAADHTVYKLPERWVLNKELPLVAHILLLFWTLLLSAHVQARESVLVHGASGGVWIAACQTVRANGLKVWGTAGTEEGQRLFCKIEPTKCLVTKKLTVLIKLRNLLVKKKLLWLLKC